MSGRVAVAVAVSDCDDGFRRRVLHALEIDGRFARVVSTSSVRTAVKTIQLRQPDAVLVDLALPDVEPGRALDVVSRFRALVPEGPVVVSAGVTGSRLEDRVLAAGGSALVSRAARHDAIVDALLSPPHLGPGASVDVLSTFSATWQRGFSVAAEDDTGYWLVRSDGSALPAPVARDRIRPHPYPLSYSPSTTDAHARPATW